MYETTQKGNPYQITINQHIHTAHCIGFFENNGKVEVKDIASGQVLKKKKRAAIFCAKRAWDERAEKGYMTRIENDFHREVNAAEIGKERNHMAISSYHLLWFLRHYFFVTPIPDIPLVGISGSGINKDQSEVIEKIWVSHIRDDGAFPSRFATSLKIQQLIDINIGKYSDMHWGLLRATDGEFLVADCYQESCFIPITPTLAFCSQTEDAEIDREGLVGFNKLSIEQATHYYFGRDLKVCYLF